MEIPEYEKEVRGRWRGGAKRRFGRCDLRGKLREVHVQGANLCTDLKGTLP